MLDPFVRRYRAGVTGSPRLLLQSRFSHLRDGAGRSCSTSPRVAEGTLPLHAAACSRLNAAVKVQEHCFEEGISELGGARIHLLKRAFGLGPGDAQLRRLPPSQSSVC